MLRTILYNALVGLGVALVLGVVTVLWRRRKLVQSGVGVPVTHLHLDTYLFGLTRRLRRHHLHSLPRFEAMVRDLDQLVRDLADDQLVRPQTHRSIQALHRQLALRPTPTEGYTTLCRDLQHATDALRRL